MTVPTEKQYEKLRILGVGVVALAPGRRDWGPLLRRGWVEPISEDDGKRFLPPLRITPDGLRALAAAVERHGHPDVWSKGKPQQLDESPVVTKLKADAHEAHEQRRQEQLARHAAEARLRSVRRALGEWDQ